MREPIGNRKRVEILLRDNFTCQLCNHQGYSDIFLGRLAIGIDLEIHHIHGSKNNDYSNLITLCSDCHFKIHQQNWRNNPMSISPSTNRINPKIKEKADLILNWIDNWWQYQLFPNPIDVIIRI